MSGPSDPGRRTGCPVFFIWHVKCIQWHTQIVDVRLCGLWVISGDFFLYCNVMFVSLILRQWPTFDCVCPPHSPSPSPLKHTHTLLLRHPAEPSELPSWILLFHPTKNKYPMGEDESELPIITSKLFPLLFSFSLHHLCIMMHSEKCLLLFLQSSTFFSHFDSGFLFFHPCTPPSLLF